MKLLFDNNLSPKLVAQLADVYPASTHVASIQLGAAADTEVWQHAQQGAYCLVTKDSDFNELLASKGFPPKVIWIRLGNCTTSVIATLLRNHQQTITEFMQDQTIGLLELT